MSIPILTPYVAPFKPVGNITPFTYRDGVTYLEILEGLKVYLNDTIVPFVNDNFEGLGDDFETQVNLLITQVNEQLTAQDVSFSEQLETLIGAEATINDIVVAAIINDVATATRILLNSLYASKATETTVTTLDTLVTSGRLSDANLQIEFALKSSTDASLATLNTLVTSGRLSDASLIGQFALKSIENIVTTGRLSDASLQGEFVLLSTYNTAITTLNTLVNTGRLSNASLIAQFPEIATYKPILIYATVAALQSASPANGTIAIASNLLSVYWARISGAWVMVGVAKFVDAADYTASGITPATGMFRRLASLTYNEEYYGGAWIEAGTGANIPKTVPTLSNSWVAFGGSTYDAPFYRRDRGLVTLGGLIKSGTSNTTILTLPAGCRPLLTRQFNVSSGGGLAQMEVSNLGVVRVVAYLAPGTNANVNLDQISFIAEQ